MTSLNGAKTGCRNPITCAIRDASSLVRSDSDDLSDLPRHRHRSAAAVTAERSSRADYRDVPLGDVGATFGVVLGLLRFAVLIHRDVHHFLLQRSDTITEHNILDSRDNATFTRDAGRKAARNVSTARVLFRPISIPAWRVV